ncbi:sensor histidine kinase [Streptomyces phaeochromogenes]|uniref:sensor histidine kinase n=1 Tax=Streptomyces phaeochromogenes TaxID=1923 RepID=UPI0022584F09|nr:sensor histidine kinase [Streptomyces phaeochromogenes]MCX5603320.1 sensor histidine kinase [Streptomyces phaeochromogenes]WRZ27275.1 sensor histidine kinase [Streptomyces phaeochromogenes]
MAATPRLPLLKRIPPGIWTAVIWCAGLALTMLMRFRLPGQEEADAYRTALLSSAKWEGWTLLALGTALTLAGCVLMRRRPLWALALMLSGSIAATSALSVGAIPLLQFLAVDLTLYFIAASRTRRTGIVAISMALCTLAGYLAVRVLSGWAIGTTTELIVALTAVIAWLIGDSMHQSRVHAEQVRTQAAAQAVTAERLRIARELHDMVAHTIGIVALQAGAARRVIDTRPELAREALGEVENASRETLSGLRRMLGALRRAEPGQAPEATPLDPSPAPGLADIDRLAERTTAAGVHVEVRWRGERHTLPPEICMSAYRIVQEAVTNVVRHAGTGSCRVTVDCRDEELAIEVVDSGNGPGRAAATGYGLLGMRERVGLLHGEFSAAPRPEGGFRVAARLPVPAGVR